LSTVSFSGRFFVCRAHRVFFDPFRCFWASAGRPGLDHPRPDPPFPFFISPSQWPLSWQIVFSFVTPLISCPSFMLSQFFFTSVFGRALATGVQGFPRRLFFRVFCPYGYIYPTDFVSPCCLLSVSVGFSLYGWNFGSVHFRLFFGVHRWRVL